MLKNIKQISEAKNKEQLLFNYRELEKQWAIKQWCSSGNNIFQSEFNVSRKYEEYLIIHFSEKKYLICHFLLHIHQAFPEVFTLPMYHQHTQMLFDIITRYNAKYYSVDLVRGLIIKYISLLYKQQKKIVLILNDYNIYNQETFTLSAHEIKEINKILTNSQRYQEFIEHNSLNKIQKDWSRIQSICLHDTKFKQFFPNSFLEIFRKRNMDEINFSYLRTQTFPNCRDSLQILAYKFLAKRKKRKYIEKELKEELSLRKVLFLSNYIMKQSKKTLDFLKK